MYVYVYVYDGNDVWVWRWGFRMVCFPHTHTHHRRRCLARLRHWYRAHWTYILDIYVYAQIYISQAEVFGEIEALVQSALDIYIYWIYIYIHIYAQTYIAGGGVWRD